MKELPFFNHSDLAQEFKSKAIFKTLPPGFILMQPGDAIRYIPILVHGTVRVVLQNEAGDEHFLYHIFPGESCAFTLTCCQANRRSEIKAITEDEVELYLLPSDVLEDWMQYEVWRKFVGTTLAQRFTELLETIELIAFSKLDEQVWNYLLRRVQATGDRTLKITHQEIATELNSPREVITRLLHQLQKKEKIALGRNVIEVLDTM